MEKQKKNSSQIMQEFYLRQSHQFIAIAIALFLVLLCAVLYKRPDFLGEFSKVSLYGAQITVILSFIVFTAYNWRCPSCDNYLGMDINRRVCKHCKTRLR